VQVAINEETSGTMEGHQKYYQMKARVRREPGGQVSLEECAHSRTGEQEESGKNIRLALRTRLSIAQTSAASRQEVERMVSGSDGCKCTGNRAEALDGVEIFQVLMVSLH
jgi:hypothetical protein